MGKSLTGVVLLLFFLFLLFGGGAVEGQEQIEIDRNQVWTDFPERIDFNLILKSADGVDQIFLEYGVEGLSCGEVTNRTEIEFEAGSEIEINWRWEFLEHQLIPPGAIVWWQWSLVTDSGELVELDRQSNQFLDEWFVWRSVTEGNLTIHWYRGSERFARELLQTGLDAIVDLGKETGLLLNEPIDIYIYEEGYDFALSLPGAPAWAGGVAFPEYNVVMLVTNEESIDYGIRTVRHELGHIVIQHLVFNCFGDLPTWLSEGLAQVAEGSLEERQEEMLLKAVAENELYSVAQLESSFSVHSERAHISYIQSYSMVRFLLDQHGADKMNELLLLFKRGTVAEDALQTVYGLDNWDLEDAWRLDIGAERAVHQREVRVATVVPTISFGGAVLSTVMPTEEATAVPTGTMEPTVTKTKELAATAVSFSPPVEKDDALLIDETNRGGRWWLLLLVGSLVGGIIFFFKERR